MIEKIALTACLIGAVTLIIIQLVPTDLHRYGRIALLSTLLISGLILALSLLILIWQP